MAEFQHEDLAPGMTWRERHLSVVVVLTSVFVLAAVYLPHDAGWRPFRVALALIGIALAPGWVLARRSSQSSIALVHVASCAVVSCSLYVILDFAGNQMNLRLTPVEYVVPGVLVGIIAMLALGTTRRQESSVEPIVLAAILVAVSLGSAVAVHDLIPAPAPESTFTLSAPTAQYSNFTLSIAGHYVPSQHPQDMTLTIQVNYLTAQTMTLPRHTESFNINVNTPHTVQCDNLTVQIITSSGQYLSPRIVCPS